MTVWDDAMHKVSRAELSELKSKYEQMRSLRLEDQAHPGGDPRLEMAALAERFPGSLREIDELTLGEIGARIEALSRCVFEGEAVAPWMPASARFHQLMRGALAAKKWIGARRSIDSGLSRSFCESIAGVSFAEDALLWAEDLARVARPPSGKLTVLVFERLAAELGIAPHEARARVLGPRK